MARKSARLTPTDVEQRLQEIIDLRNHDADVMYRGTGVLKPDGGGIDIFQVRCLNTLWGDATKLTGINTVPLFEIAMDKANSDAWTKQVVDIKAHEIADAMDLLVKGKDD